MNKRKRGYFCHWNVFLEEKRDASNGYRLFVESLSCSHQICKIQYDNILEEVAKKIGGCFHDGYPHKETSSFSMDCVQGGEKTWEYGVRRRHLFDLL